MSFVIYNTITKKVVSEHTSERGARISFSNLLKKNGFKSFSKCWTHDGETAWSKAPDGSFRYPNFAILDRYFWSERYNPMVKVKNLMSGTEVEIRADEVGSCLDPSTERYWTM